MKIEIPEFKNESDFQTFVAQMPEKDIQGMNSNDWVKLYRNIDNMRAAESGDSFSESEENGKKSPQDDRNNDVVTKILESRAASLAFAFTADTIGRHIAYARRRKKDITDFIDDKLEKAAARIESTDPEKAKSLRSLMSKERKKLKQNKAKSPEKLSFVQKNIQFFSKLYQNYRMQPDEKADIINLALKSADKYVANNPEVEKYACQNIAEYKKSEKENEKREQESEKSEKKNEKFEKKRVSKRIRNAIYKTAYPDDALARANLPTVSIKKFDSDKTLGQYCNDIHNIIISPRDNVSVSTMAHETYHSMQGLSSRHLVLKMLNHKHVANDRLEQLYDTNKKYFFNVPEQTNHEKSPEYRQQRHEYRCARRQQPIEYAARLFGIIFKYRVHQQALFKFHVDNILKTCGLSGQSGFTDENGRLQLRIAFDNVTGTRGIALRELNDRYLSGDMQKQNRGNMFLIFDCDNDTQNRIFEKYRFFNTQLKRKKDGRYNVLQEVFPDTYAAMQKIRNSANVANR